MFKKPSTKSFLDDENDLGLANGEIPTDFLRLGNPRRAMGVCVWQPPLCKLDRVDHQAVQAVMVWQETSPGAT